MGIRIQPISCLVQLPYLILALRKSLVLHYMDQQGDASAVSVSCVLYIFNLRETDNYNLSVPDNGHSAIGPE